MAGSSLNPELYGNPIDRLITLCSLQGANGLCQVYSLFIIIIIIICSDYVFKTLLVGDHGVGKSAMLARFTVRPNIPLLRNEWTKFILARLLFYKQLFLFIYFSQ